MIIIWQNRVFPFQKSCVNSDVFNTVELTSCEAAKRFRKEYDLSKNLQILVRKCEGNVKVVLASEEIVSVKKRS